MPNRQFPRLGWALAVIAGLVVAAASPAATAGDEPRRRPPVAEKDRLHAAERKVQAARKRYEEAVRAIQEARGIASWPAKTRELESHLEALELELDSLRRRDGSEDDKERIEIAIEKTRASLEEHAAENREQATAKRFQKLEAAAGKQLELLRRAEEHFERARAQLAANAGKRGAPARDKAQRLNQLEAEVRDLRRQMEGAENAGDLTARLRERIAGRLAQAREEMDEVRAGLREAEAAGLGREHASVVRLHAEGERTEKRIAAMEDQLEKGRVGEAAKARRRELAHAIEMRMVEIKKLMAANKRADGKRKGKKDADGRRPRERGDLDEMAQQIERLGVAVRELYGLVQRHHGEGDRAPRGGGERGPRRTDARRDDVTQRMKQMHDRIAQLEAENARLTQVAAEADMTRRQLLQLQEQFEHLRDHGHFHEPGEN